MRKVISDVYEKTSDAVLVEKHFGANMLDNNVNSVIVSTLKDAFLKKAKELEAEENAKKK